MSFATLASVLIACVLTSLFSGLYYIYNGRNENKYRGVQALTFRVIFSFALFLLVIASFIIDRL